jgi:hypothetical protein
MRSSEKPGPASMPQEARRMDSIANHAMLAQGSVSNEYRPLVVEQ